MSATYQLPALPARIRVDVDIVTGRREVVITIRLPERHWLDLIPWPSQWHADGENPVPGGRDWKQRRASGVLIEFEYRWGSWQ